MAFLQTFKNWIKNNKEDILSVAVMSFIITAILSSYTFYSLAPQEGWYSIYARNILQDGLVPYRDFFLVVPPVFLYIWTVWQAIFGDNFIVFHSLSIFFQISCVVSFYFLFNQIFNKKISVVTALFLIIIKMFIEWDNGQPSYNILAFTFMALMALFTIKQINFIRTYKQISTKWLWWLGAIFAISFLNKQTNGSLTITASTVLLMVTTYRVLGLKCSIKHFGRLFAISVLCVFILLLPLIIGRALPAMINDLFLNTSKGTPFILLVKVLFLPFPKDYLIWYFFALLAFLIITIKPIVLEYDSENKNLFRFLVISLIIFCVLFGLSLKGVLYNFEFFTLYLDKIAISILFIGFSVSLFLSVLILCRLFYRWFKENIQLREISLLVVIFIMIAGNVADSMSSVVTFPQFFAIILGLILSYKFPKFNKGKNCCIYLLIVLLLLSRFILKLQQPMHFYWQSGSVLGELSESFIPRLKGIKLPVEEKEMYEDIYNLVHHYTADTDTILAFNNNTVFYDLTGRNPYTQYISLYHDVSPDYQPLEVLEQIKNNPPKIIIFNKLSDRVEQKNEKLFRSYGTVSGQRKLRDFIVSLQQDGKYVTVKEYKRRMVLDRDSLPPQLLKKTEQLKQNIGEREKEIIFNELLPYIVFKNSFLEEDTELYVLVRADIMV